MPVLPIYNCFHPVLKKKTESITEFNTKLKMFIDDMFETMYKADGTGLAANQVGVSKSIIIVDTSYFKEDKSQGHPPIAMINPILLFASEEESDYKEGCLSVPTINEEVTRPEAIEVRFFDIDMHEHTLETDKLTARVIQHEIDHLNGILFWEKISSLRRTMIKNKLKKLERGQIEADYPMILPNGELVEKKPVAK